MELHTPGYGSAAWCQVPSRQSHENWKPFSACTAAAAAALAGSLDVTSPAQIGAEQVGKSWAANRTGVVWTRRMVAAVSTCRFNFADDANQRTVSHRYLNGTKADDLFAAAEDLGQKAWVDMGACGWQEVGFFHLHRDGVDWVFVDHPSYQRPGAAPRILLPSSR